MLRLFLFEWEILCHLVKQDSVSHYCSLEKYYRIQENNFSYKGFRIWKTPVILNDAMCKSLKNTESTFYWSYPVCYAFNQLYKNIIFTCSSVNWETFPWTVKGTYKAHQNKKCFWSKLCFSLWGESQNCRIIKVGKDVQDQVQPLVKEQTTTLSKRTDDANQKLLIADSNCIA